MLASTEWLIVNMHPVFRLVFPSKGAAVPERFNYSSLLQIQNCPRQWWLLRSQYTELNGPYPQPASPGALLGQIIHILLDRFAHELTKRGNPPPGSIAFQNVRRSFEVRRIAQELRLLVLGRIAENPRVSVRALESALSVDRCVSDFKRLLQHCYDPSVSFAPSIQDGLNTVSVQQAVTTSRKIMPNGFIPEVAVELSDPPVNGRIDLVITSTDGDTVIDYKSGSHQPEHEEQTVFYAVLWSRAKNRTILDRVLVYADGEQMRFGGLTKTELTQGLERLRTSVKQAIEAIQRQPPIARPDNEQCRICPVRQLCPEFWVSPATIQCRWTPEAITNAYGTEESAWKDLEIDLASAEDLGSGFATELPVNAQHQRSIRLLVTVPSHSWPGRIAKEKKVKLLSVGLRRDGSSLRIVFSSRSEIFWEAKAG